MSTTMQSALRTVESRWAMMIVVRFSISLSSACCTTDSEIVSSALVASSRISTAGL
ncbi:MAG: hypothetical protein L6W00_24005 [Lentisphaeria bacterium]|nr:MAG: hypothetical protein L6W00_24005 [Lentisphaeria bacterium]